MVLSPLVFVLLLLLGFWVSCGLACGLLIIVGVVLIVLGVIVLRLIVYCWVLGFVAFGVAGLLRIVLCLDLVICCRGLAAGCSLLFGLFGLTV